MKINILALGDRFSAAYQSLEHELMEYGELSYRMEQKFKNADAAIEYIRNSSFNLVVMPNPYGNKRRQWIYIKLKEMKFPVVVFDRGALPNSWFFDTGFNADSTTYYPIHWDKKLNNHEKEDVQAYIEEIKKGDLALEEQGERIGGEELKRNLHLGKKKVIFIPFQRPNDTVIQYFSNGYSQFVDEINKLSKYIKKNLGEEWCIVAKKHPLETGKPTTEVSFVEDDTNIYDLIEMSDLVVLINSGVGVLSMLWEKPVLYFGETFYNHNKINAKVNSYLDILYYMNNPIDIDSEKVYSFIYYLKNKVYSFAEFETEKVLQKDGSYRNITRYIDFHSVIFPSVEQLIKKKILLITQVIPWPINRGSAQRTDQMLRALLENGYKVDVIVSNLSERGVASKDIEKRLSSIYKEANFFVRRHPSLLDNSSKKDEKYIYKIYIITRFLDIFTFQKYKVSNYFNMPFNIRNLIKKKLSTGKYDIFYSNYLYNVPSNIRQYNCEVIADIHDLQYRRIENDVIPSVNKLSGFLYKLFFRRSELQRLNIIDKIISISNVETDMLKKVISNKNLYTIPATADAGNVFSLQNPYYDITFIGSNSDANVDSLLWFLNECFEKIVSKNNKIKFLIQGRVSRNKLLKENKVLLTYLGKNITISDYVEDLSDIYVNTKLIICPITKGSGMKIKVIEALSYGKAIIGTSIAFEGIKIENSINGAIADSNQEFIDAVLKYIGNEEEREILQENAYKLFLIEHSFQSCVEKIKKIVG